MFISVLLNNCKDSNGKVVCYEPHVKIDIELSEDDNIDINKLKLFRDGIQHSIQEGLNWCILKKEDET